jgi:hypothetical protein
VSKAVKQALALTLAVHATICTRVLRFLVRAVRKISNLLPARALQFLSSVISSLMVQVCPGCMRLNATSHLAGATKSWQCLQMVLPAHQAQTKAS